MAEPYRRSGLPPELAVAALVVTASFPLGRLFRTGEVGTVALAAAAAGAVVAWALRRARAPALLAASASFAAFVWFTSIVFFRDTMLGPLPSGRSLTLIWQSMAEGVRRSQSDTAPVPPDVPFLCLAALAVWATAWLADDAAIKLRHPMLAIGVSVPLFVLPGTIVESDRRWLEVALYLGASLWVIFQDERFRLAGWGRLVGLGRPGWRPGLAVRLGVAATLLALVATPILPGYGDPPGLRGVSGGGGDRITVNPLVSIRPRLTNDRISDLFIVRSPVATYWRLTALDRFDGLFWTSGPQRPGLKVTGRSVAPQSPALVARRVRQDYEILNLAGPWAPAAFEPVRVEGLRGVGADPATRTLITPRDLDRGSRYAVVSRIPTPSFADLDAAAEASDPALRRYLALPPSLPKEVGIEARRILERQGASGASPFRRAVALQDYLRTFTYNEDVALGHSIPDLVSFLRDVREGYCEQFASAMAVLARSVGLPSRVAVGFAVGAPGTQPDTYLVTTRQSHAWVEIFLEGHGWTAFEPTPREEWVVVPPYTRSETLAPAAPPPADGSSPSPTASPTARTRDVPEGEAPDAFPAQGARNRLATAGFAAAAALLAALLALPVGARVRRTLRYRRARTAAERVSARYLDFLDWCAAARLARRPGETPREYAGRLAEFSTPAERPLRALAELATDAVYAPATNPDPARATRFAVQARRSVAATLPLRSRALSLAGWGWWRTDPGGRRTVGARDRPGPE